MRRATRRAGALGAILCFVFISQAGAAGPRPASITPAVSAATLPVSGAPVAGLEPLDEAMLGFMSARGIRAGALAVMKDRRVVLEHGYGWRDEAATSPLPPDAPFRLASVVKPVTAAAILKLARQGRIDLDDRVFCLQPGVPCWLDLEPAGTLDPRLEDVTVCHLIHHRGGWDRDISGDPMFMPFTIADALGIPSPPGKTDIARYMMGQALDFTPDTRAAYSNFGYMLLGLVIEQATGLGYTRHVQDQIFDPLQVAREDVELGRTLPVDRNPREPFYSDPFWGPSVFNRYASVPAPDGTWYHEALDANGGLIATARAIVQFLDAYWISGAPRESGSGNHTFFGSLPGTFTIARQRPDGVNYVALFNQSTDASGLGYGLIEQELDAAVERIASWPGPGGSVTLLSPNGGEMLVSGAVHTILWSSESLPRPAASAKLLWSKDGGESWKPIATLGEDPGRHDWTVPVVLRQRSRCRVKVVLKDAGGVRLAVDASDRRFTISPPG